MTFMDATFFPFLFFFYYYFYCEVVHIWGSSLKSTADSLPSCLDYPPAAVHLLFAGKINGSCFALMATDGTVKLFFFFLFFFFWE